MKAYLLAALLLPLSGPAFAQAAGTISPDGAVGGGPSIAPAIGGSVTNPGGLDFGNPGSSGIATAGSPAGAAATGPGQLNFGRTITGTGGMPSGGAGIGSSAAGVPGTDDEYTRPIYGIGR